MSDLAEKVKTSIERLRAFEPKNGEGYYLAFSGGKDSVVCKALMDMAGVKYDATYRVTSVDPPELVQFIKEKHPDVKREVPRYKSEFDAKGNPKPITMWNLIPKQMFPPTRTARYCCQYLKESGGDGRMTVTGVRWEESARRKANQGMVTIADKGAEKELGGNENFSLTRVGGVVLTNDNDDARRMVENCYKRRKTLVNPIIEWTNSNVWEFIKAENVPYCGLYDDGFERLGCIGCPMSSQNGRERDFKRWPKYKESYLRAFAKMIEARKERNRQDPSRPVWKTGGTEYAEPTAMDIFNWWMEYKIIPGQLDLFDMIDQQEEEDE